MNSYGFKAVALVAFAVLFWIRPFSPKTKLAIDVLSVGCVEAGMLLLFPLLNLGSNSSVVLVASTFIEIGLAWMIARWGACNARVHLRLAFLAFILGSLAVSLSKIILAFLPAVASSTLMLLVMPLSIIMLIHPREPQTQSPEQSESNGPSLQEHSEPAQGLHTTFLGIACSAVVFFLVWSYLNVTSKFEVGHYGYGATSLPSMVVISQIMAIVFFVAAYCWSFVLRRNIDLELLWRIAFFWLASAVAVSAISNFSLIIRKFRF